MVIIWLCPIYYIFCIRVALFTSKELGREWLPPMHVNSNTTLHEDEAISHKKCTINDIQWIFGRILTERARCCLGISIQSSNVFTIWHLHISKLCSCFRFVIEWHISCKHPSWDWCSIYVRRLCWNHVRINARMSSFLHVRITRHSLINSCIIST